jgi:hypothetical protein
MKSLTSTLAISGSVILALFISTDMAQSGSGIVSSVIKAPVAPDGDVAGAATDFVINLSVNMDPAVPGRVLRKGESIRINRIHLRQTEKSPNQRCPGCSRLQAWIA